MTSRERQVLELIKKNPMISHAEIADALGISRSTAAVYIASLTQQGEIIGKQYVLAEDYVVCLGASITDIFGFSDSESAARTLQTGRIRMASGGAVRNIGENLARLGTHVRLLSSVGDDRFGDMLLRDCAAAKMDIADVKVVAGGNTAVYFAFTRQDGEASYSLLDRDIDVTLDVEYVKSKEHIIKNARAVVVSDVPNEAIIPYLHSMFPDKPIYADTTTSTAVGASLRDHLDCLHSLQANRQEMEQITGIRIRNDDTLSKAADYVLRRGVHRVVITLGSDGAYYKDADGMALRRRTKQVESIVNATGAGDAFAAGYVHCLLAGTGPVYAVDFAMACAVLALSSESGINPNLCQSLVEQTMLDYCGE